MTLHFLVIGGDVRARGGASVLARKHFLPGERWARECEDEQRRSGGRKGVEPDML